MTLVSEEIAWPEATERLLGDPAFRPVVEEVGPVRLRPPRGTPFESLAAAIIYQQLAGRAARTIHGRFVQALDGVVRPETVLEAGDEPLRGAGLSRAKLAAVRDLAEKTIAGEVLLDTLGERSDGEVVESLTRVRGIGPWTAQMYLMFDLRRPDIWPVADLGVRAGMGRILGLDVAPSVEALGWIGVGYRPWRSAVAWYCWQAVDVEI